MSRLSAVSQAEASSQSLVVSATCGRRAESQAMAGGSAEVGQGEGQRPRAPSPRGAQPASTPSGALPCGEWANPAGRGLMAVPAGGRRPRARCTQECAPGRALPWRSPQRPAPRRAAGREGRKGGRGRQLRAPKTPTLSRGALPCPAPQSAWRGRPDPPPPPAAPPPRPCAGTRPPPGARRTNLQQLGDDAG